MNNEKAEETRDIAWTPELAERIDRLAVLAAEEFLVSPPPKAYDKEKFALYLVSIGAEIVDGIHPEDDHFDKVLSDVMDEVEPESDERWRERSEDHLRKMARETGKFPAPMPFQSNKGFLLPNELAQKILALGSFPPA